MVCPHCGSANVSAQVINQQQLKNKHHNFLWWLFVSWWWMPIKWLVFTVPALIVKIFKPKKQKIKNKTVTMFVCQQCGHTWKA